MKCALGPKKLRRIARLTGKPPHRAFVRGGWEHYVAEVFFRDGSVEWVNYKTGARDPAESYQSPWWGALPAPNGCEALAHTPSVG